MGMVRCSDPEWSCISSKANGKDVLYDDRLCEKEEVCEV